MPFPAKRTAQCAARHARAARLPECAKYFPTRPSEVTGTPIRASLVHRLEKAQATAAFGLSSERRTLLVMGGSQGAQGINPRACVKRRCSCAMRRLRSFISPASRTSRRCAMPMLRRACRHFVAAFHHRMEEAYRAADFCIARSGAASLTELSHFALPSLLIPFPHAADDHQTLNAKIFDRAGAGTLLHEREITGGLLAEKLRWFIDDPARLSTMAARSAELSPQRAAERVVETMLKFCGSAA
jgi:UDP-N-acetylglucosamine--N-acetylmuramyl-(pentapeptide) pyrophosphoryl-undecaprenol N-acetylglucosamine transferase